MKKMILTAVMLAAAALCRAQQPAETGERREWLTSFTAVEVSAPLDVKFVQVPDTEAPKIVYDTKGSYTTKFRAEVKDKVLRITTLRRPPARPHFGDGLLQFAGARRHCRRRGDVRQHAGGHGPRPDRGRHGAR